MLPQRTFQDFDKSWELNTVGSFSEKKKNKKNSTYKKKAASRHIKKMRHISAHGWRIFTESSAAA